MATWPPTLAWMNKTERDNDNQRVLLKQESSRLIERPINERTDEQRWQQQRQRRGLSRPSQPASERSDRQCTPPPLAPIASASLSLSLLSSHSLAEPAFDGIRFVRVMTPLCQRTTLPSSVGQTSENSLAYSTAGRLDNSLLLYEPIDWSLPLARWSHRSIKPSAITHMHKRMGRSSRSVGPARTMWGKRAGKPPKRRRDTMCLVWLLLLSSSLWICSCVLLTWIPLPHVAFFP